MSDSAELNLAQHLAVHAKLLRDNPAWQEVVARIERAIISTLFGSKLNQQEEREHLWRKQIVLRELVGEIDVLLAEYEQMKVQDNG